MSNVANLKFEMQLHNASTDALWADHGRPSELLGISSSL